MNIKLIPVKERRRSKQRWRAFRDYMSNKKFGAVETLDAWHHFSMGWGACFRIFVGDL